MFSLDMIMTTDVLTVNPSDPVSRARELMREHRIRHVPVVREDGQLVGLVSQTDLFAATDSFLREKDDRLPVRQFPVSEIMVTDLATIEETGSLRQAALFIEKHRIGSLPVVRDGQLVGIITDADFVGVAINLLEQIEDTEPDDSFDEDFEDVALSSRNAGPAG